MLRPRVDVGLPPADDDIELESGDDPDGLARQSEPLVVGSLHGVHLGGGGGQVWLGTQLALEHVTYPYSSLRHTEVTTRFGSSIRTRHADESQTP
jgi:hypothetical protein